MLRLRIAALAFAGLTLTLAVSCGDRPRTPEAVSTIFSGVHGGNGGDPRILKLSKARVEAANWVGKVSIRPELLSSHANPVISSFLSSEEFLRDLAADIMA